MINVTHAPGRQLERGFYGPMLVVAGTATSLVAIQMCCSAVNDRSCMHVNCALKEHTCPLSASVA
jgi:hypothetical protein